MLDYKTLLVSLGVSAVCLLLTLMGTWMARRRDGFLLTWVIGLAFLVPGIFSYSYYAQYPTALVGFVCTSLMLIGFAIIYSASIQFCHGGSPLRSILIWSALSILFTGPPMLSGFDGIAFISLNAWAALLLFATALVFWRGRQEATGPLSGMAGLYALTGISFLLCGIVLLHDGRWVLGHAPENWAENLNIAISIAGMTGVGAMSLMVHQARITEHHRREALTDSLTGLRNRRALFGLHETQVFTHQMAVIVFDIDRFKSINDQYGHAVGDSVIRALAQELGASVGLSTTARLGGEEFAAVVRSSAPGYAEWLAERIRKSFSEREIRIDSHVIRATVSAGIAYGDPEGRSFEGMLSAADSALYLAKRNGRNRVEIARPPVDAMLAGERSTA